jgi:hypothetical protein
MVYKTGSRLISACQLVVCFLGSCRYARCNNYFEEKTYTRCACNYTKPDNIRHGLTTSRTTQLVLALKAFKKIQAEKVQVRGLYSFAICNKILSKKKTVFE